MQFQHFYVSLYLDAAQSEIRIGDRRVVAHSEKLDEGQAKTYSSYFLGNESASVDLSQLKDAYAVFRPYSQNLLLAHARPLRARENYILQYHYVLIDNANLNDEISRHPMILRSIFPHDKPFPSFHKLEKKLSEFTIQDGIKAPPRTSAIHSLRTVLHHRTEHLLGLINLLEQGNRLLLIGRKEFQLDVIAGLVSFLSHDTRNSISFATASLNSQQCNVALKFAYPGSENTRDPYDFVYDLHYHPNEEKFPFPLSESEHVKGLQRHSDNDWETMLLHLDSTAIRVRPLEWDVKINSFKDLTNYISDKLEPKANILDPKQLGILYTTRKSDLERIFSLLSASIYGEKLIQLLSYFLTQTPLVNLSSQIDTSLSKVLIEHAFYLITNQPLQFISFAEAYLEILPQEKQKALLGQIFQNLENLSQSKAILQYFFVRACKLDSSELLEPILNAHPFYTNIFPDLANFAKALLNPAASTESLANLTDKNLELTAYIFKLLKAKNRLILIARNPRFLEILRNSYPDLYQEYSLQIEASLKTSTLSLEDLFVVVRSFLQEKREAALKEILQSKLSELERLSSNFQDAEPELYESFCHFLLDQQLFDKVPSAFDNNTDFIIERKPELHTLLFPFSKKLITKSHDKVLRLLLSWKQKGLSIQDVSENWLLLQLQVLRADDLSIHFKEIENIAKLLEKILADKALEEIFFELCRSKIGELTVLAKQMLRYHLRALNSPVLKKIDIPFELPPLADYKIDETREVNRYELFYRDGRSMTVLEYWAKSTEPNPEKPTQAFLLRVFEDAKEAQRQYHKAKVLYPAPQLKNEPFNTEPKLISMLSQAFDTSNILVFELDKEVKIWNTQISSAVIITDFYTQLIEKLTILQQENIILQNLAPQNILIFKNKLKIFRFDYAITDGEGESIFDPGKDKNLQYYLAPEIHENNKPQLLSDMFSLGAILYTLMMGKPYDDHVERLLSHKQAVTLASNRAFGQLADEILPLTYHPEPNHRCLVNNLPELSDTVLKYLELQDDERTFTSSSNMEFKFEKRITDSRNAVIYQIRDSEQKEYVLKLYLSSERDEIERLQSHRRSLQQIRETLIGRAKKPELARRIIRLDDSGELENPKLFYVIMPKYEKTLSDYLKLSSFNPREAVRMIRQLLELLDFLHREAEGTSRTIHRDIKPANLFYAKDETGPAYLVLGDFDLSTIGERNRQFPFGTQGFVKDGMFPRYDERIDIMSTGIVFYMMLTGEHPSDNDIEKLDWEEAEKKLLAINLSSDLIAVLKKWLNSTEVYQSAKEALEALDEASFSLDLEVHSDYTYLDLSKTLNLYTGLEEAQRNISLTINKNLQEKTKIHKDLDTYLEKYEAILGIIGAEKGFNETMLRDSEKNLENVHKILKVISDDPHRFEPLKKALRNNPELEANLSRILQETQNEIQWKDKLNGLMKTIVANKKAILQLIQEIADLEEEFQQYKDFDEKNILQEIYELRASVEALKESNIGL